MSYMAQKYQLNMCIISKFSRQIYEMKSTRASINCLMFIKTNDIIVS